MKINISEQEKKDSLSPSKILDISWGTIFKISATIIFLYFIFLLKDVIIWFLFALVISILFEPAVSLLTKRKVPRVAAVALVYSFVFGVFSYVTYMALPFLVSEIQNFSQIFPQQLPGYFEKISPLLKGMGLEAFESFDSFLESLKQPFEEMTRSVFGTVVALLGGFFASFFTISMAFFLSLEKSLMEKGLALFSPKKYEEYFLGLWNRSKEKVVGWFLMRIIGVIFVGLSSFIAFKMLEVNYPVSLAALIGVLDFIPVIGPLVATIFIVIVVSTDSFLKAVLVLAALAIIQLIENGVLLPALSRRMIKVPPVIVLVGLFIGGHLWGVLGAILAVPLFAILFEFIRDFLKERREKLFLDVTSQNSVEEDT